MHDIICMANNMECRDAYIIIGIDEEKECSIQDVKNDSNRRNTQKMVDFLRDKKFAGGVRPRVVVEPLQVEDGEIDIIIIKLYKESKNDYEDMSNDEETNNLIVFCKTPRTRKEICDYLGLNSVTYAIQTYVNPLVEAGVIKLSIPDKPKSPKQLYYSVEREE